MERHSGIKGIRAFTPKVFGGNEYAQLRQPTEIFSRFLALT